MSQLLLIGLLVGFVLVVSVVRLKRGPKRRERWMPDIRRVV